MAKVLPIVVLNALLSAVLVSGCGARTVSTSPVAKGHRHAHPEHGPHGGFLIEWGDEEYHGELVVNRADKEAVVYILDESATKAPDLQPSDITDLILVLKSSQPPAVIPLIHDPFRTSEQGIAFVGRHDALAGEGRLRGELSGKVKGKPYVHDFAEKAAGKKP